jgi:hypothetical protein
VRLASVRHPDLDSGAKIAPKTKSKSRSCASSQAQNAAQRLYTGRRNCGLGGGVNTVRQLRESWRADMNASASMPANRNERLIQMIRECLILTSVTASVDLEDAVPRSRKATPSECERVVSLFGNLAGVSDGTVAVAGRNCSMACVVAPSPEASGGAADPRLGCSGRIMLLAAESGQAGVRFKVRRGRRGKPGSLTLTFNPSRLLTGADEQPTLIDDQTGKPAGYPSTQPWVMNKLLQFPFELLEAINHSVSKAKLLDEKVKAERIRTHQMELNAFLSCSDANGLLQVLAIAMHQPVSDLRVVRPLARHLGLVVKPEPDSDRDRMKSVTLEKRQGRRKLFLVRFSADSAVGSHKSAVQAQAEESTSIRLTVVVYPDGLASIVRAARRRVAVLIDRHERFREHRSRIKDAEPNSVGQLSAAFCVLGCDPSADRLERRSLADWLVPYLLHGVLRLDVIGNFTRQNLDRLSRLEDKVAVAWREMRAKHGQNYARAIAEATGLSDQTVYDRRRTWRKEFGIDIAIPFRFYMDLLSLGSLSMARPDQRAALLAADTADAEALERALSSAFADFDRNRSLMGEIAGATPSAVEVKAIHPTLLRQRQGGSTDAGKGRGTRSGKPVEERSRRTPNRGPTQATTRSQKNTKNTRRPSPGVRGSRR